ncbi:MAG: DNA alkylation repair protein, partial [Dehalococcoidia bacterium]|nr:DNA alkylation repair protein [Dehalococcoidia bacterium]
LTVPSFSPLGRLPEKLTEHLVQQLWVSGIHGARILASMVEDPKTITEEQLEHLVGDFDSWDLCDQCSRIS